MQENHLYEYAVIRIVPKVEREEFINVGVGIFSKSTRYINMRYHLDNKKLKTICPDCDPEEIQKNLESFKRICIGEKDSGPIGQMDAASRFRWLTATRSSVIQTSQTHPGFSKNLEKTLDCLFEELVL